VISTSDFPQADRLSQVGEVARAVAAGHHSDDGIEKFIGLGSQGRQGRYYRLAASILGLIRNSGNHADLTPLGEEYAKLQSNAARKEFLARCIVDAPVFREALRYVQKNGPSQSELREWFMNFYPGAGNTARRRFATFANYLTDSGLVQASGMKLAVAVLPGALSKESADTNSTSRLLGALAPRGAPTAKGSGSIFYEVDAQKRERAVQAHWKLIAGKSAFLSERGFQPFENELIDLYAEDQTDAVLYEMKSVFDGNVHGQLRKALAQLLEYRFVFNRPAARLCIVTNSPIAKREEWLLGFLQSELNIAYEWTENYSNFQCSADSKGLLGKFAP